MKYLTFILTFCFLSTSIYANENNLDPINTKDPFESYNRAVFEFNQIFNDLIAEDIANFYLDYVPIPAQKGFDNFFDNLKDPLNMVNGFLQGDIEGGLTSLMRFSINSVFGLFGLLDIATPAGLNPQKEDLGQTLYVWGVWKESTFIMLPILGPYTVRGLVGSTIDSTYNPIFPYVIETDQTGRTLISLGSSFVDYTKIIGLIEQMEQQVDPYIFMRESYLQHRKNLIYNGNPPQPKLDDFDFD